MDWLKNIFWLFVRHLTSNPYVILRYVHEFNLIIYKIVSSENFFNDNAF